MVLKSYWVSQQITLVNFRRMTAVKRGRSEQIGWKRDPLSFFSKTKVVDMFFRRKNVS